MKFRETLFRLFFLTFLLSQNLFAQDKTLHEISPSGKFQIINQTEGLPDLVTQFTSYLIDLESGDSTLLGVCHRHDSPPPNWFWSNKSDYLIFEKDNSEYDSEIVIFNLSTKKIKYKIDGTIPVSRKFAFNFWDSERGILFFFKFENGKFPQLRMLEVFTQRQELVKTFSEHFYMEVPIIRMDKQNRKVWLNSESYEY